MFYIALSATNQFMTRSVTSSGAFTPLPSTITPAPAKRVRVINDGTLIFVLNNGSMWAKSSLQADGNSAGCCVGDVGQMPSDTYMRTPSDWSGPQSSASLQGPWTDASNGGWVSDIIPLPDNTLLAIGGSNSLFLQASLGGAWTYLNEQVMKHVSQLPNGTFLGVTTSNELMWRDKLGDPWQGPFATGVKSVVPSVPAGGPGGVQL